MINRILNYQITLLSFQFTGKSILKNPLFSGSAIMIVGSNFTNFVAYIYHLIMGRLLGPSAYGELASTLATLGLFTTAFGFIGMVIIKFVSSANENKLMGLYYWFQKKAVYLGFALLFVFLFVSPIVSKFMNLPIKITIMIGPLLFLFLFTFVYRSFLQGLLRFSKVIISTSTDLIFRIVFGVLLVYMGYSSFGAVFGILLASVVSYFVTKSFLKDYRIKKTSLDVAQAKKIVAYSVPVIIFSVSNNLLISSDVILAKHYFDTHTAGIYASLSTLGKIIFYGASPVGAVMFPIISKRHFQGHSYTKVLYSSILMTLVISLGILFIYYLYPGLMVRALFGEKFIAAAPYLFPFAIFVVLYSLSNLIAAFYMSIEKTNIVYIPLLFSLLQIVGMIIFHNKITDIIIVSITSSGLMLTSMFIYFVYDQKKTKIPEQ